MTHLFIVDMTTRLEYDTTQSLCKEEKLQTGLKESYYRDKSENLNWLLFL